MPGFDITLVDPISGEPAAEGEICVELDTCVRSAS